MVSLEDRLVAAENEFLFALSKGQDALAAFDSHWESLMADAGLAMQSDHVDPNLPTLVHHAATRIATLADISTELYVSYDNITTQFLGEVDILMSQLSLSDCPPVQRRIVSSPKTSPEPEDPPRNPTSKRRRDSTDSSFFESIKSRNRSRIATQFCDDTTETTTRLDAPLPISQQLPQSPPQSSHSRPHGLKRKRRSSDVDYAATGGPQKRLYAGPRLHAVSDSYRTFQIVDPGSYLPSSPSTATQRPNSTGHSAASLGGISGLPSSDRGVEPCRSPRLTPLPCIGFSEADDWAHLSFDFLEPECQSSFPPTFDGMDLFIQSLTETSRDDPSQALQPYSPVGCEDSSNQTPLSVPNLMVDSMPSPTSSSYPSTPSPQPSLDFGPAFLQSEPSLPDVSFDEDLLTLQSMLPSAAKKSHAHDARDALLLMRREPPACDAAWSPLFLSTDSMLTFSIPPEPLLPSLTMSSEGISSSSG